MYYREGVAQELPRERFSGSVVLPITHLGARRPLAGSAGVLCDDSTKGPCGKRLRTTNYSLGARESRSARLGFYCSFDKNFIDRLKYLPTLP